MLAAFDDRQDFTFNPSESNLFVEEDLAATLFGMAVHNEAFYDQLRQVMTADRCARSYFKKQRHRAAHAIQTLESSASGEHAMGPMQGAGIVSICANNLQDVVTQVCDYRDSMSSERSLSVAVLSQAARLLVDILEMVCNHNYNIQYGVEQHDTRSRGSARDWNLYRYLIADPPPGQPDDFVIPELGRYPLSECGVLERLQTLVRESLPVHDYGSQAYASKLNALIQKYDENIVMYALSSPGVRPRLESSSMSQRGQSKRPRRG